MFSLSLESESTTALLQNESTEFDRMDHHEHQRISHRVPFFDRLQNLTSSSSFISPRFIGLCFLVFLYYLGYGYLQVRLYFCPSRCNHCIL